MGNAMARLARARITVAAAIAAAVALAVALFWPMDPVPYLRVHASGEMVDRSGRQMYAVLNDRGQWCFRRELGEISPYLVQATVAAEDERFYSHAGVDPIAVVRAVWQNVSRRRVVSGASTLTMQVVKDRSHPSRSLGAKARQALHALRLDARATKEAILEAYLNTAPYGLNLVGCEAASRRFFGKPSGELTLSEAALLAGLPKAPTACMPLVHPARALVRRDYVLRRMREEGCIEEETYRRALAEPVTAKWHEFPKLSPHLATSIREELSQGKQVRVTLDADVQRRVEELVRGWVKRFDGDVTNAAAIVIDVSEATVLARVGSADFFSTPGGGQVDGCRAPRSPGSALKPFTYALAMERQRLYACETLLDDSLDYGLYSPGNFDGEYNGLIPAGEALRRSLNVPAITVLERVGVEPVYAFLESAGLTTLRRPAEDYGLGLTIGNCEVRLEELAAAYCALANLGEYRPLRIRQDQDGARVRAPSLEEQTEARPGARKASARRILSRGTCLKVYEMLEQPLPEEFSRSVVRAKGVPERVCWKTGTSTGYRDAWAFVFNQHYVVGVWTGNNSGRASPSLVGSRAALPLAARLFRALEPKSTPAWPDLQDDLREVTVCAVSGLPATPWCARTNACWLPRNQFLHRKCDMHYPHVERWPGTAKGWDLAHIESPVELARTENDIVSRTEPAQDAGARKASTPPVVSPFSPEQAKSLRILIPTNKAEYVLTGEPGGDRIKLRTSVDAHEPLHWYLNDHYVGDSTPESPRFVDLAPGTHKLACMTAGGALDLVHFQVYYADSTVRFEPTVRSHAVGILWSRRGH
jgi:penicillin-binding protein 1C